MPLRYALLIAGWLVWMVPFAMRAMQARQRPARVARRARWGVVVQSVSYWLLWTSDFWNHAPPPWHIAAAAVFFSLGALLAWTSLRALGRHWRIEAALNDDHELVRHGPYRIVRHPIYASMLCLLLATGMLVTPLAWLAVCLAIFIAGTEIRVRTEDALLASRFGGQFRDYRRTVSAYIPYLR